MILDRVMGLRADASWNPLDDRWYGSADALSSTFAGFPIGPASAKRVAAVFACTSLLAETLASLPCILYRRLDNGDKERAKDHRLYKVLRQAPNSWQTPLDFFTGGQMHCGLRGNGLAEIQERGRRVELVPLHPDLVTIEQLSTGRLRYEVRDPKGGPPRRLSQDDVMHVRDLSDDGIVGQARATLAREAISVAGASEAFVGRFFRNNAAGRVVFQHPGTPTKEQRAEHVANIQSNYAGWNNNAKVMMLSHGITASELGKGHEDSSFIVDPRKFQVADIARFWRVPLFMIGLEEKSTSWGAGISEQKIGFVTFTMKAWLDRWAQAMMRDLLTPEEQDEFFIEFLLADLLRGDLLARSQSLAIQRIHGVVSANEWRAIENMNRREDAGGDEYQKTPTGAAPNPPAGGARRPPANEDDEKERASSIPGPLLADAAHRIAAAEGRDRGKRSPAEDAEHRHAYALRVLAPLAATYGTPEWLVGAAADRIVVTAEPVADRPAQIAQLVDETFRAGAGITLFRAA